MDLETITKAKELFEKIPRTKLGFFPTYFHKLDNLSEELGVEFYLKRDDITGPSVFGGNKIRKLEFLIGDAINQGAEYIFTYGATQSNHAMQTATVCRKCGLKPILYLIAVVPPSKEEYRSNLLLDKILGAEVHIINMEPGMTMAEAKNLVKEEAKKRMDQLEKDGCKYYDIPTGGATPIGSLGFANGFLELSEQLIQEGINNVDYIVHATGTGGSLAGLCAGRALLRCKTSIVSIMVSNKAPEYQYPKKIMNLANDTLKILGQDASVLEKNLNIDPYYVGEGYEIPTDASSNAIKLLARKEGIIIDPVYTAKAMSGLVDYINKGKIQKGSKIVFWHTGGGTALFAEKEMVGKIFD